MDKIARQWEESAKSLQQEGRIGVSCTDINERTYGSALMPPEWDDSVCARLPFIKRLLVDEGFEVVLVNSRYFEASKPETVDEARLLLPKSNDSSYGLHFKTGPDDLVWAASLNGQLGRSAGALNTALEKYDTEIDEDELARAIHKVISTSDGIQKLVQKLSPERQIELLTP